MHNVYDAEHGKHHAHGSGGSAERARTSGRRRALPQRAHRYHSQRRAESGTHFICRMGKAGRRKWWRSQVAAGALTSNILPHQSHGYRRNARLPSAAPRVALAAERCAQRVHAATCWDRAGTRPRAVRREVPPDLPPVPGVRVHVPGQTGATRSALTTPRRERRGFQPCHEVAERERATSAPS